jgi:F0F1-type ATP synthase alpha subunit
LKQVAAKLKLELGQCGFDRDPKTQQQLDRGARIVALFRSNQIPLTPIPLNHINTNHPGKSTDENNRKNLLETATHWQSTQA